MTILSVDSISNAVMFCDTPVELDMYPDDLPCAGNQLRTGRHYVVRRTRCILPSKVLCRARLLPSIVSQEHEGTKTKWWQRDVPEGGLTLRLVVGIVGWNNTDSSGRIHGTVFCSLRPSHLVSSYPFYLCPPWANEKGDGCHSLVCQATAKVMSLLIASCAGVLCLPQSCKLASNNRPTCLFISHWASIRACRLLAGPNVNLYPVKYRSLSIMCSLSSFTCREVPPVINISQRSRDGRPRIEFLFKLDNSNS